MRLEMTWEEREELYRAMRFFQQTDWQYNRRLDIDMTRGGSIVTSPARVTCGHYQYEGAIGQVRLITIHRPRKHAFEVTYLSLMLPPDVQEEIRAIFA